MKVIRAWERSIQLRQSYRRMGKKAFILQCRYSSARQMKRAAKQDERLQSYLSLANRLLNQQRHDENKLYSIHEPDVRCIAKGRVHKRYEFGCKASFVTTSKDNWVISAAIIGR